MYNNFNWTLIWCWHFILGVRNISILSWYFWSYVWNICCPTWDVWCWFIWRYLSWISWIVMVSRGWGIWNLVSGWIYWNDLTNLVVDNSDFLVGIFWSCSLTCVSLLVWYVTINYYCIRICVLVTSFIPLTSLTWWFLLLCALNTAFLSPLSGHSGTHRSACHTNHSGS